MTKFEEAFIQCLRDGVYPGPSNINERKRADHKRLNRLNGQETKERLALMYLFGVPYQRGNPYIEMTYGGSEVVRYNVGSVPDWPYIYSDPLEPNGDPVPVPAQGSRKWEIVGHRNVDSNWKLRRK